MDESNREIPPKTLANTPFTLSNVLSLTRAPLALLYLISRPDVRICVVILAMITDVVDGYLARRYRVTTKIGAILDPLMDKFFVFFIMGILFYESRIYDWQVVSILTRDIAIVIFGFFLFSIGKLKDYTYRSVYAGKMMTALQFGVIFLLSLHLRVPSFVYYIFFLLGPVVLLELFFTLKSKPRKG